METYRHTYRSPLGTMTFGSNGEALIGVWFEGSKYFGDTLKENSPEKALPVFEQTEKWMDQYFAGKLPEFTPKIDLNGSEFQREVWEILKKIPYGETVTYGEIAKRISGNRGKDHMSAQAVGGAVGRNPISIIIPCHRVIGANGNLTGYAGGIERKIELLKLEKAYKENFWTPKKKKLK